jgi:Fibronectin type III domain
VAQLRVGNAPVTNLKLGSTQVTKAYLGATLVWSPGQEWLASAASLSLTVRSSTWGPALVPSGRTVHWDASHEASFTYKPDTAEVVSWADLSGNSWELNEAIAGSNLQLPTRVIGYNGLPTVKFEADEWLVHWINSSTPEDINLAQPLTIQIVAAASPYPGIPTGLIGYQSTAGSTMSIFATAPPQTVTFAAGAGVSYTAWNTDQHLITAVFNGASSTQRVDGVTLGTGNPGTDMLRRLQIGITHQIMELVACEYVIYNRVLTTPEITYNEDLLRTKWFKPPGVWTGSAATITIAGSARTWYTGAAPAFRPDRIESCFGWWDASDVSTFTFSTGAEVVQWRDKTSAAHHLTAPSTGDRPDRIGTINGLSTVTFDGAAWMLIGGPPGVSLPPQPTTVFVVAAVNTFTSGNSYGIVTGSTEGVGFYRHSASGGNVISINGGVATTHAVDASPHLFAAVFDRGLSQQRIDSLQVGAVNTGPKNFGELRVGYFDKMVGRIAEICVYDRNLNSTEITEVESYLSSKWFGPPLPQTWSGSAATETITATSGAWALAGPPGAPTSVLGTPGNTQVALTWTTPVVDGGSAITDYIVQYAVSPPGTSWTTFSEATSTATAATVTGLTNGTGYVFRVAAVNANGTGPYSTASATYTPVAGETWTYDFTDDPDGDIAGFTARNETDFYVSSGLGVVWFGGGYVDWHETKQSYNTSIGQAQLFRAEVQFTRSDAGYFIPMYRAASDLSTFAGMIFDRNGSYTGIKDGGGGPGGSGNWAGGGAATVNQFYRFEISITAAHAITFKVDGVTIATDTNNERTGNYVGFTLAAGAKMRKALFEA